MFIMCEMSIERSGGLIFADKEARGTGSLAYLNSEMPGQPRWRKFANRPVARVQMREQFCYQATIWLAAGAVLELMSPLRPVGKEAVYSLLSAFEGRISLGVNQVIRSGRLVTR